MRILIPGPAGGGRQAFLAAPRYLISGSSVSAVMRIWSE